MQAFTKGLLHVRCRAPSTNIYHPCTQHLPNQPHQSKRNSRQQQAEWASRSAMSAPSTRFPERGETRDRRELCVVMLGGWQVPGAPELADGKVGIVGGLPPLLAHDADAQVSRLRTHRVAVAHSSANDVACHVMDKPALAVAWRPSLPGTPKPRPAASRQRLVNNHTQLYKQLR